MTTTGPVDLRGRHALVTGASRGLGAMIARTLAAAGAHVYLNFVRGHDAAAQVMADIQAAGGTATLAPANLAHPEDIRRLFADVVGPDLDILIHNAALGSFKPARDVRANQWDLTMQVNARALLLLSQEAAVRLEARRGRIIAVSSLGSTRVVPAYGAIGISKAALESTVRYLSVEFAPQGVKVNAVTAGLLDLPSVRQHPGFEAMAAASRAHSPVGELGRPQAVADVVLWLCSPLADGIAGQTLVVDGGASLTW
jgi:enoyl-[acyl-carrier protein] reductase III